MGRIVAATSDCGFGPWWDRWSAPRRLTSGIEKSRSDEELEELLSHGIAGSAAALVVKSAGYGDTKWTGFESARISAAGIGVVEIEPESLETAAGVEALKRKLRCLGLSGTSGSS